jgi:hypothetical protein
MAFASAPATDPSSWSEVRLTDTSFNLEQAPTRFNGAFFLGDYEGLAAAGNDFVSVWGMPNGTSSPQESIFFRRANDPPAATPSLAAKTGTFAAPNQTPLATAALMTSSTSPPIASSPTGTSNVDPAALSVALSLSQLPAMPAAISNPVPSFAQAPLLTPSLTGNLPPVSPSPPGLTAEAASDRAFANFDAELSLARLVDDLVLDGWNFNDLTPAQRRV